MTNIENKTVIVNDMEKHTQKISKDKQMKITKMRKRPSIEREDESTKEEMSDQRNKGTAATQ